MQGLLQYKFQYQSSGITAIEYTMVLVEDARSGGSVGWDAIAVRCSSAARRDQPIARDS